MQAFERRSRCTVTGPRPCGDVSTRLLKLAGAAMLGVVLFLPTVAEAQATLAGTLRDTSGAALPGVTVEASSNCSSKVCGRP